MSTFYHEVKVSLSLIALGVKVARRE